ncbi:methyltransferase domain-containing protein [Nocardia sp. NPDC059091]|uniref:methyltransferase domain-containing protein n=1 Tax=Nocardia sp. NPDC059091 TaxID=3346724 RepID=UPI00369553EC
MSDLFADTAWHYARYRPGYPSEFLDEIVRSFQLDGSGRLLDLGCGTGQLTVPLSKHVREAVGVDPEPQMLIEAAAYTDWAVSSSSRSLSKSSSPPDTSARNEHPVLPLPPRTRLASAAPTGPASFGSLVELILSRCIDEQTTNSDQRVFQ